MEPSALLLLLLLCGLSLAQDILPEGPIYAMVGSTATFRTLLKNPDFSMIIWNFNDGENVKPISALTPDLQKKDDLRANIDANGTLTLSALTMDDSGEYAISFLDKSLNQLAGEIELRVMDSDKCEEDCGDGTCKIVSGSYWCECPKGYTNYGNARTPCSDIDECAEAALKQEEICGAGTCHNTKGSYRCKCPKGYTNSWERNPCTDIDECKRATFKREKLCGDGTCKNIGGSYLCECPEGYTNAGNARSPCIKSKGRFVTVPPPPARTTIGVTAASVQKSTPTLGTQGPRADIDECAKAELTQEEVCGAGTCKNVNGSYWCECPKGYTNYGNARTPCSEVDCDSFIAPGMSLSPSLSGLADISSTMRNACLALSTPSAAGKGKTEGEVLLEIMFDATESSLSPAQLLDSGKDVTDLLQTVEDFIEFIGPQLKHNRTRIETNQTDAEIVVHKGESRPSGPLTLISENAQLNTDWDTVCGTEPYPGFAVAALLSYKNLHQSVNQSFDEIKAQEKGNVEPSFKIISNIVSVVVSNPAPINLRHPVYITFSHVQTKNESEELERRYMCVYLNHRGAWDTDGCSAKETSNSTHTICRCTHLSSFAVLMALYPMEHTFGLQLVTKIGLIISMLCLIISIFTFAVCRSIKGTRTTIHLHLCICLFVADLVFLAGISQTKPEAGCRLVAALLHYFFLGVFTWMLLEGVMLYRMLVRVFDATIRSRYLYMFGYGVPLGIVTVSASVRPMGYGTERYCWLSQTHGLIWSFFGPVCVIIIINIFFFIITLWKMSLKFNSLNADLSKLQKIRKFTVIAIAQMCILGLMWVFGFFLFEGAANLAMAYIFTILNSLQGALIFVMHCLLPKQVRDEYARIFSSICPSEKKRRSESDSLSNRSPSSSQQQTLMSGAQSGQSSGKSQS